MWIGWLVSGILAFGIAGYALFKWRSGQAYQARSEGQDEVLKALKQSVDELNARMALKWAKEKAADEKEASGITDLPGAIDFVRNSWNADGRGPSRSAGP